MQRRAHFVAGLQGTRFPTPFAKPPGRGKSPAPLNFLWGAFNLALGAALLVWAPLSLGLNYDTLAFAAGALLLGLCISSYFKGA